MLALCLHNRKERRYDCVFVISSLNVCLSVRCVSGLLEYFQHFTSSCFLLAIDFTRISTKLHRSTCSALFDYRSFVKYSVLSLEKGLVTTGQVLLLTLTLYKL